MDEIFLFILLMQCIHTYYIIYRIYHVYYMVYKNIILTGENCKLTPWESLYINENQMVKKDIQLFQFTVKYIVISIQYIIIFNPIYSVYIFGSVKYNKILLYVDIYVYRKKKKKLYRQNIFMSISISMYILQLSIFIYTPKHFLVICIYCLYTKCILFELERLLKDLTNYTQV